MLLSKAAVFENDRAHINTASSSLKPMMWVMDGVLEGGEDVVRQTLMVFNMVIKTEIDSSLLVDKVTGSEKFKKFSRKMEAQNYPNRLAS